MLQYPARPAPGRRRPSRAAQIRGGLRKFRKRGEGSVISFEKAFDDTEKRAASTAKSAGEVAKLAKRLEKEAKHGNINGVKRARQELNDALGSLRQETANAAAAWPFTDAEETDYLKEGFATELIEVAGARGLQIHRRDEQMIAHPSILRVLPGILAIRIDKKQTSSIRPSHLTDVLAANQNRVARVNTRFIETLYRAYSFLAQDQPAQVLGASGRGQTVPLAKVYEVFTVRDGQSREYTQTDFARELYRLQTDGPQETRSGARVFFHTGTRSAISFVSPQGEVISYHGIEFSGGK